MRKIHIFQTNWALVDPREPTASTADFNKVIFCRNFICLQLVKYYLVRSCTFSVVTAPWSAPWISTLNLRFRKPTAHAALPFSILPLFNGGRGLVDLMVIIILQWNHIIQYIGTFNNQYNNRTPITFSVPDGVQYAALEAVITGHGSDENVWQHYL